MWGCRWGWCGTNPSLTSIQHQVSTASSGGKEREYSESHALTSKPILGLTESIPKSLILGYAHRRNTIRTTGLRVGAPK